MKGKTAGHLSTFFSPPFVVAAVLLVAAGVLAGPLADLMGYTRIKRALPLKAELGMLDADALGPYHVLNRRVHKPAILESLGTDKYLSWTLKDTSLPAKDPLHLAILDVTYYSGGHNLVPHTPDVCMAGMGYQMVKARNTTVDVAGKAFDHPDLPVRACTFEKTSIFRGQKVSAVYTFYCNGTFTALRSGVRYLINKPNDTYAFFSKVEISFPGATLEQSLEGAKKLLGYIAPVLISDHWPDFEAAELAVRDPGADRSADATG